MRRCFLLPLLVLALAATARGQESAASWESAARKLQGATATIRIWGANNAQAAQPASVTVCSGVCVAEQKIVTAAFAGSDSRVRVTLAGGAQADAKLQAIDEYSGLALLKCEAKGLTPVAPATGPPQVGQELLTAAAWGLEQPLVARAIVGGVDRQHPGTKYPPLLMCDALTTETASGAGLVDRDGKLHGLIVAAEKGAGRRGWTYAVPVTHVQRILRAADEQKSDGVVILKRRRPVVGMELTGKDDAVVVERVARGGPAEKAGIKAGDEVLATDGVAIRAAYQAVVPTLFKQPGDTTTFRLRRAAEEFEVTVVLGGGVELPSAPLDLVANFVEPKVQLIRDARGIVVNPPLGGVA
jgi:S1-C subfamily serine protease